MLVRHVYRVLVAGGERKQALPWMQAACSLFLVPVGDSMQDMAPADEKVGAHRVRSWECHTAAGKNNTVSKMFASWVA